MQINILVAPMAEFWDEHDNVAFVRNLADAHYADTVRNVWSIENLWVVQVVAEYEWTVAQDFDGEGEATLGNTPTASGLNAGPGPVNVFLETIRDVSANYPGAVDSGTLRKRVVLHETVHRFAYSAHDRTVMVVETMITGTDAENELDGGQLRHIMAQKRPR